MTNADLLQLVKTIESDWYYNFKGYPFEDTDIEIRDDETGEITGIDADELKKELELLINEYIPCMIEEEEFSNHDLYHSWIERLTNFLNQL